MKTRSFIASLCAGSMLAAGAGFAAEPVAELPLTEVILYSSGVGSFAHQGKIEGDASVRFRMSREQLNDLLKSLYVTASDDSVGIRSVTYPTELPLNILLEGYRINVTAIHSLSDILRQLPGAEFELGIAGVTAPVKGKLIAVETKQITVQSGNTARVETVDFAVMLTDNGFRRFPVADLTSVVPTDKALLAEMTKALTVLAEQRDQSAKPIDINLSAKKGAFVRMAYVIEAPVWKASYRLELGGKSGDKANLQGWAMVENPTRTEWKNVTLSLISGRPESFIQDLYTSLYLPRPVVQREDYAAVGPLRHGIAGNSMYQAMNAAPAAYAPQPQGKMRSLGGAKRKMNVMEDCAMAECDMAECKPDGMTNGAAAPTFKRVGGDISATSGAMGELYCYKIAKPVTLGSRQSAMLELVSAQVTADKISFYSMRARGKRPLNAVMLKNDSGLLLPQGPVTIFDGKNYGGDASLSDLASGQEQILSYGLDLEVIATPSNASAKPGKITKLTVDRGILRYSTTHTVSYKCEFENKSKKDKVILFETPRNDNAKIVNNMKPFSETANSYRFLLPVKAGEKITAEVKLETPVTQSFGVNIDTNFTGFTFASQNADLDKDSKELAEKLLAESRKIKDAQQELRDIEDKIRDLSGKHDRTRNSINSNINSELRTRLNKRLAETDEELDKMYQQKDAKKTELQKLRKEFGDFLQGTAKN